MKKTTYFLILTIAFMACKKPYIPPASNSSASYLVVQGVINPGSDSTIIVLSRTVNLSNKTAVNPVTGASVMVQSDQSASFPLTDAGNGNYVSAGLNLDNNHQYRLSIKTADGRQYLSDLEQVTITPPIDSIGFNIVTAPDTGLQIYANAHDAGNKIHYFRWDYVETWQFHTKLQSLFVPLGGILVPRTPAQDLTICYTGDISSDIVLGSSAKLTKDVIYQNPLLFIKYNSEKIEDRYSVLVRQYALTADAYNFWVNLRKNTEQLGSIFDAQPSQIPGNIHCISNPAEPVIGYLSVSTVASVRTFIYNSQLPSWVPLYPYACTNDTAKRDDINNLINYPDIYYATEPIGPFLNPTGYLYTDRECANCTIRGTKTIPSFWK